MEPADLNPKSSDDAPLEDMLRVHLKAPPLADDGFSARVLQALAPPTAHTKDGGSLKPWLCLAGAGAGLLLARLEWPERTSIANPVFSFAPEMNSIVASLREPSVLYALLVTATSLAFVYWRPLRKRFLRA